MVEIFGINIVESLKKRNITELVKLISPDRRKRAMRFCHLQDTYRTVLGELLIRYALCSKGGYLNRELIFDFTAGSKPKLLFPHNIHFNLSHSGDWVVCAVSSQAIGIDIECLGKVDLRIAKRFFTDKENAQLSAQVSVKELQQCFYRLWTLKESYVKADGRGLLLPMRTFTIILNEQQIILETEQQLQDCLFKSYQVSDKYLAAICSIEKTECQDIKEVTITTILKSLLV